MNKQKPTKILKYSEESMKEALAAVKNGMAIKTASRTFNVPRTTLYYKNTGLYPEGRKMGPACYLTTDEENGLVKWILHMSKCGFPINKEQLLDSVQMIVKQTQRKTPFENDRPGRRWYELFLKRHPEIRLRVSQNLTTARANVTEEDLRSWFQEVEKYIKENNFDDVIKDPRRIFNGDETAFFLNPKGPKVLAQRGEKAIYSRSGDEKECLTTLITGNAAGDLAPPMIVFSYERIPSYVCDSVPADWGIGKSENGWMTGETFFMYITNIFHPWVKKKEIPLPIILFVDGHTSHLTLLLSEFCSKNGIILVALFPNATHILQPMDVAVFHALKNSWKKEVMKYKVTHGVDKIKKETFAPLLSSVLKNTITRSILENGFRACGLFPLNSNAVQYDKYIKKVKDFSEDVESRIIEEAITTENYFDFKRMLNEEIGQKKIEEFRKSGCDWKGPKEDTSLFHLWLKHNKQNDFVAENEPNDNITEIENDILVSCNDSSTINNENYYVFDADWVTDVIGEAHYENVDTGVEIETTETEDNRIIILQNEIVREANNYTDEPAMNVLKEQEKENILMINELLMAIIENVFEIVTQVPQLSQSSHDLSPETLKNIPKDVPSPFKSILFWPKPSTKEKKRRSKARLPPVASSSQWQEYNRKSAEKKQVIEIEKNERKRKREEKVNEVAKRKREIASKKAEKIEMKKKNKPEVLKIRQENTNKTETIEKSTITDAPELVLKKEVFVIVQYEKEFYPGKIKQVEKQSLDCYVSVMEKSGANWKWPEKTDLLWYQKKDIVKNIVMPKLINKRGIYKVPEMNGYEAFL